MSEQFSKIGASSRIKTLPTHRLVCGWASVSQVRKNGAWEKYYDLGYTGPDGEHYRDHVSEKAILTSSLRFMRGERVAGEAHKSAAISELEKAVEGMDDPATRAAALEILQAAKRASQPPALIEQPIPSAEGYSKVKKRGEVVFAFPLLSDVMEPMGIQSDRSGLIVGIQTDPDMFARYQSGELKQFSIGGRRTDDVIVGEA